MKMRKENFSCNNKDLIIRGKIYRLDKIENKAKTVILSHGFLANQSMCKKYATLLASMGYVAVTFDFCGGGIISQSDGKTENMSITTEEEDLIAVYNYISSLDYVDDNHITLFGCSQGGLVSALVAKKLGSKVDKLILLYPAFCIGDDARNGHLLFYKFDPHNVPDILGNFPVKISKKYADSVIEIDPLDEIIPFDNPVLLLQGDKDIIVDMKYAIKASKIYPNCKFYIIKNGRHMFTGKADRLACEYIKEFMQ